MKGGCAEMTLHATQAARLAKHISFAQRNARNLCVEDMTTHIWCCHAGQHRGDAAGKQPEGDRGRAHPGQPGHPGGQPPRAAGTGWPLRGVRGVLGVTNSPHLPVRDALFRDSALVVSDACVAACIMNQDCSSKRVHALHVVSGTCERFREHRCPRVGSWHPGCLDADA